MASTSASMSPNSSSKGASAGAEAASASERPTSASLAAAQGRSAFNPEDSQGRPFKLISMGGEQGPDPCAPATRGDGGGSNSRAGPGARGGSGASSRRAGPAAAAMGGAGGPPEGGEAADREGLPEALEAIGDPRRAGGGGPKYSPAQWFGGMPAGGRPGSDPSAPRARGDGGGGGGGSGGGLGPRAGGASGGRAFGLVAAPNGTGVPSRRAGAAGLEFPGAREALRSPAVPRGRRLSPAACPPAAVRSPSVSNGNPAQASVPECRRL